MKKLALVAAVMAAATTAAFSQSLPTNPAMTYGMVPTVGQWNNWFAQKQDTLGYAPINKAGDVMLGRLGTAAASATKSGFNLSPGGAPSTPNDGDVWVTSAGIFAQINGATIGPLSGASAASFAATPPLAVTFPGGITTFALSYDATLKTAAGSLGIDTTHANTWTNQTLTSPVFTGTVSGAGTVPNSVLANSSVSVNGTPCTLGSSCTVPVSSIVVGTTTVTGGTSGQFLYNNAGVLGSQQAIGVLRVTKYLTPGTFTYTPNPNVLFAIAQTIGGGGAGGGAPATVAGQMAISGGGGGGGYAESLIASPTTQTVTVGAGGAAVSGANGGGGGTSSFGSITVATGGGGGFAGSAAAVSAAVGGSGGSGTAGDVLLTGQPGVVGWGLNTGSQVIAVRGVGGAAARGGGGANLSGNTGNAAGSPGSNYGGGGSAGGAGASSGPFAGGAGAGGSVVVYEYCSK